MFKFEVGQKYIIWKYNTTASFGGKRNINYFKRMAFHVIHPEGEGDKSVNR
jgi:hypothetical protein